jgi:hypothetical protein
MGGGQASLKGLLNLNSLHNRIRQKIDFLKMHIASYSSYCFSYSHKFCYLDTKQTQVSLERQSLLLSSGGNNVSVQIFFQLITSASIDFYGLGLQSPGKFVTLKYVKKQNYPCNKLWRFPHFLDNQLTDGGDGRINFTPPPNILGTM